jgi:sortase B
MMDKKMAMKIETQQRLKKRGAVCLGIGIALLVILLLFLAVLWRADYIVSRIQPQGPDIPFSTETAVDIETEQVIDEWPQVDWEYWQNVNSDVVAWLTIPGTSISSPVVQATVANPKYYLTHDVYGSWNYLGCPYISSDCSLESPNVIIYGHNTGWSNRSFAALVDYRSYEFATEHQEILFQTPDYQLKLTVSAADIVPGWQKIKTTGFDSVHVLRSWFSEQYGVADMVLDERPDVVQVYSLITCSYFYTPKNERTIVYASELIPTQDFWGGVRKDVWQSPTSPPETDGEDQESVHRQEGVL